MGVLCRRPQIVIGLRQVVLLSLVIWLGSVSSSPEKLLIKYKNGGQVLANMVTMSTINSATTKPGRSSRRVPCHAYRNCSGHDYADDDEGFTAAKIVDEEDVRTTRKAAPSAKPTPQTTKKPPAPPKGATTKKPPAPAKGATTKKPQTPAKAATTKKPPSPVKGTTKKPSGKDATTRKPPATNPTISVQLVTISLNRTTPPIPGINPKYLMDLGTYCTTFRDCMRGLECHKNKCHLYAGGKKKSGDYADDNGDSSVSAIDPSNLFCKSMNDCARDEVCTNFKCEPAQCSISLDCPRCYDCRNQEGCFKPTYYPACRNTPDENTTPDPNPTDEPTDDPTGDPTEPTAVTLPTTTAQVDPNGVVCEVPRFKKEAINPLRHRGWYFCNSELDDSLKKFKTSEKWRCAIDNNKELLFCICTALRDACTLQFNTNPDFLGSKTAQDMRRNAEKNKNKKKKKKKKDDDDSDEEVGDPDEVEDPDEDGEDYVEDPDEDGVEGSDYQLKSKKKKAKGRVKPRAKAKNRALPGAPGGKMTATKGKNGKEMTSKEEYTDASVLEEQARCAEQRYKTNPDSGWTFCTYAETQGYMKRWRKCFKHARGGLYPFIGDSTVSLARIQQEKKLRYVEDPLNFDLRRAEMARMPDNLVCLCRC